MSVAARYQMLRRLATGGMAEVFLARSEGPRGFAKTLVLKRILPQLAADPEFEEMFLSEARLAAQLDHPNIVQIFDFGEADDTYFLAMELVDGPNLRTLQKAAQSRGLPFPAPLAARIVAYVCEGLAYAHALQDPHTGEPLRLVHRDVSPDNVLVSRTGAVKIADFGIAKSLALPDQTRQVRLKGKLAYMSPEQAEGKPVDARADVFSLGVVLFQLVTGTRPFGDPEGTATLPAVLGGERIPVRKVRPDLPLELVAVIDRALQLRRQERFESCREMQVALEAYLRGCGETVGPFEIARFIERLELPSLLEGTPGPAPERTVIQVEVSHARRPERPKETSRERMPAVTRTAVPSVSAARAADEGEDEDEGPWNDPTRVVAPPPRPSGSQARALSAGVGDASPGEVPRAEGRGRRTAPFLLGGVALVGLGLALPWVWTEDAATARAPARDLAASRALPAEPAGVSTVAEATNREAANREASAEQEVEGAVASADARPGLPDTRRSARTARGESAAPARREARAGQVAPTHPVEFRIRPYASVYVDGRELGQTPFAPVPLAAGKHTVRLENPELGRSVSLEIEVGPGPNIVRHNFTE